MKKLLNYSLSSILLFSQLCVTFTLLSAIIPHDSASSITEAPVKQLNTEKTTTKASIDYENPILDVFKVDLDLEKSLLVNYSHKTNNRSQNELMSLSTIECPVDTILNVSPSGCTANGELPLPANIQGLCGGNEFNAETSDGGILNIMGSLENDDLSIYAINFAPGTHHVQYMVNDSCGNVFDCEFEVVVPPASTAVVLKQNVVVTLTSSSTSGGSITTIYPENIDNGSFNPCIPLKLEIRRDIDLCNIPGNDTYNADGHTHDGSLDPNSEDYDSDEGQSIKFCCKDVTSSLYDIDGDGINEIGYIKTWLRVWEDNNLDSIFGNEGDNYNEAWTYVKVEDQLSPEIICPADVTITCENDYTELDITGNAVAYGSCGELDVEYTDILNNFNSCNEVFITRRWNVVGSNDIFCEQTITMMDVDTPINVSFAQVGDFMVENCPGMIDIGEPTWVAGPCDAVSSTMVADTFFFVDGACLKIVNQFTVVSWCDYKPDDPLWDGEGLWEHTQVIRVIEETKPILNDCEDKIFVVNDHDDIDNDGEICEAIITLTNKATDSGSENCPTDWLKWIVMVDLWGDGTYDLEYNSFLPSADNDFDDTNGNGIPDIYLNPTISEEMVNIQLPDIVGSFSHHKVSWQVRDGCNNVTTCSYDFLLKDQTPPTAVCQDTITVGIAQVGQSILWANKYVFDVKDNCTAAEKLRYTFSELPPEADPDFDADRQSSNHILTLNNIYMGSVQLPIYIWDENGNFTTCETVFLIDPSLILNTEDTTGVNENLLHQNQPNPFRESTSVSFNLNRSVPVKLTIMNATSAKIIEIEMAGNKGLNTYLLDSNLLSGQGLYYYTISTMYYQETKKMIVIM